MKGKGIATVVIGVGVSWVARLNDSNELSNALAASRDERERETERV